MTMKRKNICLILMLLLPLQTKAMEVLGLGAGAAFVLSAVVLKHLRSYPSTDAQKQEIDKKALKGALDVKTKLPEPIWGIIKSYLLTQYTADICPLLSGDKRIHNRDPLAISTLEFSVISRDDPITMRRFYPQGLAELSCRGSIILWARILNTEFSDVALQNCYLSWLVTEKGIEHINNSCSPGYYEWACQCGNCFASSPRMCGGACFKKSEMTWKPCDRPEAKLDSAGCYAMVDDHTRERGGTKLSVIIGGNKQDKEIYDMLGLKVPLE